MGNMTPRSSETVRPTKKFLPDLGNSVTLELDYNVQ